MKVDVSHVKVVRDENVLALCDDVTLCCSGSNDRVMVSYPSLSRVGFVLYEARGNHKRESWPNIKLSSFKK